MALHEHPHRDPHLLPVRQRLLQRGAEPVRGIGGLGAAQQHRHRTGQQAQGSLVLHGERARITGIDLHRPHLPVPEHQRGAQHRADALGVGGRTPVRPAGLLGGVVDAHHGPGGPSVQARALAQLVLQGIGGGGEGVGGPGGARPTGVVEQRRPGPDGRADHRAGDLGELVHRRGRVLFAQQHALDAGEGHGQLRNGRIRVHEGSSGRDDDRSSRPGPGDHPAQGVRLHS